jgi:hypothetical protein
MGNTMSNSNKLNKANTDFENFYDIIDYIATYYILTMDFKTLQKLSEKDYCDKLVVLTSDIIKESFTDMEINYLEQRIQNKETVNKMTKNNIIFYNKDDIDKLDISNDKLKSIKKKRVCIGIAKFYIKIAHLFAAIVMTINPVYTYTDISGNITKTDLLHKNTIPANVNRTISKINICDNKIKLLRKGQSFDDLSDNVTIFPKVCDMNNSNKSLNEEPGIPELMKLYLDDEYDYSTGQFIGMSESTKRQFNKDLTTFYTAFTGNNNMPPEITKFSDIKLKNYNCNTNLPITINKNDKLFVDYANNIKRMIETAANNQQKLLSIINELFTFVSEPYTNKQKIRINPKLTESTLQRAMENTRKYIINLYVTCENDYNTGINLYNTIVQSKKFETNTKQLTKLIQQKEKILNETNIAINNLKANKPIPDQQNNVVPIENVPEQQNINLNANEPISEQQNVEPIPEQQNNVVPIENVPEQQNNVIPIENVPEQQNANLNANEPIQIVPEQQNNVVPVVIENKNNNITNEIIKTGGKKTLIKRKIIKKTSNKKTIKKRKNTKK